MRRTTITVAVALSLAAGWPTGATAAASGRLATYPLVFRVPSGDRAAQYGRYFVFFRTRGTFVGHDRTGTSIPGRIALEDSEDRHDGFFGLRSRRCYGWNLGDTERLDRAAIGSRVRLELRLRRTSVQTRHVTLRRAPGASRGRYTPVYERPAVARALRGIGC